jgi:membrane associated rhomboid family serine protease
MEVKSCPTCGAMITPQLARCRRCKTYLHGTRLEGALIEGLIPEQIRHAPATATLVLSIILYYALMLAAAGAESLGGFSSYSLETLGATNGPDILLGQYWRFVTSIFVHHNPMHIFMNLFSLVMVGALVEKILDRKKMFLIYLVSGVASMAISFVWYTQARGNPYFVSGGASGAVSGMIGAAWFSARKLGPQGVEIVSRMKMWTALMLVFGFLSPGINNAAHIGGFVVGAALAHFVPAGITQTVAVQRILSVVSLASIAGVLACCGLMIVHARGFPADIRDENYNPSHCLVTAGETATDEAVHACELARRVFPDQSSVWRVLAAHLVARGETERAAKIRSVGARVSWR